MGNDILLLWGYDLDDIFGSVGGGGVVFVKFIVELCYFFFNVGIVRGYVLGFVEVGNNWKLVGDFNFFDIYCLVGLGVCL